MWLGVFFSSNSADIAVKSLQIHQWTLSTTAKFLVLTLVSDQRGLPTCRCFIFQISATLEISKNLLSFAFLFNCCFGWKIDSKSHQDSHSGDISHTLFFFSLSSFLEILWIGRFWPSKSYVYLFILFCNQWYSKSDFVLLLHRTRNNANISNPELNKTLNPSQILVSALHFVCANMLCIAIAITQIVTAALPGTFEKNRDFGRQTDIFGQKLFTLITKNFGRF